MAEKIKRMPPHSEEAEQYVLGCLLLDSSAFEPVQKKIDSSMFYTLANQNIYTALQTVFMGGIPVDIISVSEQMKKDNTFSDSGGMEYLNKLASQIVSASSAEYYASIIFDKYILRSLISLSGEVFEEGYSDSKEAKELLEYAQQKLFDLSEQADTEGVKKISDLIVHRLNYFRELSKTKKMPLRIETGFTDLDKLILGFQPGDFILIAARPSVGKSTLAMNMAQNMAIRKGKNVLFLSLEMSNEQLTDRIIASEARVSNSKLQRGEADQNEWAKVTATAGVIHESKIFLDDTSSITVADIRSKCRRFKSAENLDIIFIDYLQLIGSAVKKENRQQEVTEISRQLKILAKDMKIPVVALSQLSRASEQRSDHVPQLSDLRESGAIEQDADIVMFLYRPSQFDKAASTHLVDLVVAKNRNGSIGKVKLVWQDQIVKFDSYKQE
ncbi:MAG: replicative DNA helicase [Clostridia bacterium]|jgi:replicative DNA helicase|nr:replicative DNA helicase [Clostridia bacterium]MDD4503160.1 replicative DNA helicase [Clostridia bacterium]NLV33462.1 replicative DNA helicase [Clostridiaceae bacterium]